MIDWAGFSPLSALAGGVMIGVAATVLLLFNGRIAGISGVVGNLLQHPYIKGDVGWRMAFIGGLILAPVIYALFYQLPALQLEASYSQLVIAGLLVGIGTRYASGCTSGHGVCGISRFSVRSVVATVSFMLAGFATVFVIRHVISG